MEQSEVKFSPRTMARFYVDIPTKIIGIHTQNCSVLNKANHKAVAETSFWSAEDELFTVRRMAYSLGRKLGFTVNTDTCRQCR